MCGIFGVLQHQATGVPSGDALLDTARRMQHRGPDAYGVHAERGVGLVHTRLSLIDLSERSNQPFWDASRRYCLVYNGELYGYADLQAELERRGVVFHTTSDTEVLLQALIHLGVEAALRRLDGMFAFALYDTQESTLVLARDRFGIKPLYIHDSDAMFAFASEVDAMRPWLALQPDALTVSSYLQGFNGPMSGRSFFDWVSIVPPGVIVRVKLGGRAQVSRCLAMSDLIDPPIAAELARRPLEQLVDEVEQALLDSVKRQLCADVPVGAFCSGGIDSSLLMAMAARFHADLRVFHADIVGPLSERSAAEHLARHLNLEMKVVAVRDADFVESIPDVVSHFGFPFAAQPTSVPVRLVSQLTHDHGIKAVLTGEGSDECFLGYPWLVPNIRAALGRLPSRLYQKVRRGRPTNAGAGWRDMLLVRGIANQFESDLGPAICGDTSGVEGDRTRSGLGLATSNELSYILRTLLHRNDTMGMAASIEARFPFLDARLVRLAVNLPVNSKVRFSPTVFDAEHLFYRDKWVLRQVADRYLPRALSQRPKGMFPTSASERIRVADKMFEASFVADWFRLARPALLHLLENASLSLRFRLLHLEAWGHVCVREMGKADLSARLHNHVWVEAP